MINPGDDPYVRPPDSMRLIIPFLPPSANKIYVTDWVRKRRYKSDAAKAFEQRFRQEIVPTYLPWLSQMIGPEVDPTIVYAISTDFYFPRNEVLNVTWGDPAVKKPAKTRYKKMDTGNRLKLLHDCLAETLRIDDSHFFQIGGRKLVVETFDDIVEPQVHIFMSRQDPSVFGL